MKKIKRPSTIKMKRLLMHFVECDVKDRATLRELQDDARKVIYFDEDLPPGQPKRAPPVRSRAAALKRGTAKKPPRKTAKSRAPRRR